jgi:epoxyqueuosine reductase
LLEDTSPLVRGAAVWALSRLVGRDELRRLQARCAADEQDPDVHREWRAALGEAAAT